MAASDNIVIGICRIFKQNEMKVKELKEKLRELDDNTEIIITVCDSSRTKFMSAKLENVRFNKAYGFVSLSCIKEDK